MTAQDDEQGPKDFETRGIEEEIRKGLYETGYKRPPKQNQFKKGQSGNPKGRPRGAASGLRLSDDPMLMAAYTAMKKTVAVRDGSSISHLSIPDALFQAALRDALKGNARSWGLASDHIRTASLVRAREIKETQDIWRRYKQSYPKLLADAERDGQPPPLPHADDVVFDDEEGVRFVGPIEEGEQRRLEETITLRDVLIMQDELDRRSTLDDAGAALLLAFCLDRSVPPRLQLTDAKILRLLLRYEAMPKRILLKELFRAWKAAHHPKRRGFVSRGREATAAHLKFIYAFVEAAQSGAIDVDAVSRGDYDDSFLDFLQHNGQPTDGFLQQKQGRRL